MKLIGKAGAWSTPGALSNWLWNPPKCTGKGGWLFYFRSYSLNYLLGVASGFGVGRGPIRGVGDGLGRGDDVGRGDAVGEGDSDGVGDGDTLGLGLGVGVGLGVFRFALALMAVLMLYPAP